MFFSLGLEEVLSMTKRYQRVNKYERLIMFGLLIIIYILTVGFSVSQASMEIDDISASVRVQKDIRIVGVGLVDASHDGVSNWEEYNIANITSSISLPYEDSAVTYNVRILNVGNMEAAVSSISGLPSNLNYSISNYNLDDMLCDDEDSTQCKLGSVSNLVITIGYKENGYNSSNVNYSIKMNFSFRYMVDAVAMIDNRFYSTLQKAINAVSSDNTLTTIKLLNDTSEIITIGENKNIVLNLNDKTLSNSGNNPVIANSGSIEITNGIVTSSAATNGAINNESKGTLVVNNNRIIVSGGRQAVYNNGGNATITGTSYLKSVSSARATVQNQKGGNLTILSANIISTNFSGVVNNGNMVIGEKDSNVDVSSPIIVGATYGIEASANYSFYDGIVKGQKGAINNSKYLADIETGVEFLSSEETIDGNLYRTSFLGVGKTITFNYTGGNVTEATRSVAAGSKIGTLPTSTRKGYLFVGWFTSSDGGSEIHSNIRITDDVTYYAHWQEVFVAKIGENEYRTIQDAINAVGTDGVSTTITMLMNVFENVKTKSGQNIVFDFQNYTLSPENTGAAVIENYATIFISNGVITSNGGAAVINNYNNGSITVSGGNIISTGTRQAIYNNSGGYVKITGDVYLSSTATGVPTNSSMERSTVQNLSGGIMDITGGTIVGVNQQAISNEGTLTIGNKDGIINTSSPVIRGETYGIKSSNVLNFYDGIIKGKTDFISGSVTDLEVDSEMIEGIEVIDNKTYKTVILN